jgi:hypothetical protein
MQGVNEDTVMEEKLGAFTQRLSLSVGDFLVFCRQKSLFFISRCPFVCMNLCS